jgi:ATPase subunit of ABC transporter with duplicated ATPase domains
VLLLDEPTNDVDTDMLTATEDLLDSWPGTLIVVSHDRYLLERITDQQYAIVHGRLRHLPGGIDEYLRLAAATAERRPATAAKSETTSGAELRAVQKETAALERRLTRLADQIAGKRAELAEHDPSDHVGLTRLTQELQALEDDVAALEDRWLELSELAEHIE